MIIAVDGPAAAGKGTISRRLAQHYGLNYLDTGALYRAVGRDVIAANIDTNDEKSVAAVAENLDPASLDDPVLRVQKTAEMASVVAKIPLVRQALLTYQREFSSQEAGAVLDGRDIATVICPDAKVKLFISASAEERAKRRFKELQETAAGCESYEAILAQIKARDERDMNRAEAPLKKAEDAYLIDTTNLSIEESYSKAIRYIDGLNS